MFRFPRSLTRAPQAAPRGFVFYDIETSGLKRSFDQILQFAAIRTDTELRESARFEMSCRLMPHIVPSPDALTVTSKTLRELRDPARPSHYAMMCEIRRRLASWGRNVFVGYNSVTFDEEFLRQAFYQTLHPPFLTNTSGNARTDLLPIVRAVDAILPGRIRIPVDGKSRKTFRLEGVAKANAIAHDSAHDAMSDVAATVDLARLVRDRAPDLWAHFIGLAGTSAASAFIASNDAFLCAGMPGGARIVSPLGRHPRLGNLVYCLDLLADAGCPVGDVSGRTPDAPLPPSPILRIRANRAPTVLPLAIAPSDLLGGRTLTALWEAAARLRADVPRVRTLLDEVIGCERQYPASSQVEEQLYAGFWSRQDADLARAFHVTEWPGRHALIERIEDPRLRVLAQRLMYLERPDLLPASVLAATDTAVARRVLGKAESVPWLTIPLALDSTRDKDVGQHEAFAEWQQKAEALLQ